MYGRLWTYHTNTALFIIFNIACALAPNLPALIIFRFLAGFAGVAPLTVGSGTIADMFKQEERGRVMSLWTFPVLIGKTDSNTSVFTAPHVTQRSTYIT